MGMFFFQPFPAFRTWRPIGTSTLRHRKAFRTKRCTAAMRKTWQCLKSQWWSDRNTSNSHNLQICLIQDSLMKKLKNQSVPYFFTLTFKAALKATAVIAVFFTSRADSTPCLAIETHQASNQLDSARNLSKNWWVFECSKSLSFYCWQHKPLQICLAV